MVYGNKFYPSGFHEDVSDVERRGLDDEVLTRIIRRQSVEILRLQDLLRDRDIQIASLMSEEILRLQNLLQDRDVQIASLSRERVEHQERMASFVGGILRLREMTSPQEISQEDA